MTSQQVTTIFFSDIIKKMGPFEGGPLLNYKWQRNLSLVIPVNTSVCFVLSFADRRRLYLRRDTRNFFSLRINKNLHQANVQKVLNVSHYHH